MRLFKKPNIRAAAALLSLVLLMPCAAGCQEKTHLVEDAMPYTGTTTAKLKLTVPDGQMGLNDVVEYLLMDPTSWELIGNYTHTDVDDTHAVFDVFNENNGAECELAVTYDAVSGKISAATMSYGNTQVDVLNGDPTLAIRRILQAMEHAGN